MKHPTWNKYLVLAQKGFSQNLLYTASHLINTVASAVFGVIYISVWRAVTPVHGFADYTPLLMTYYVSFNQVVLWLSQFGIRVQRRIADSVRSGQVAQELARPIGFFQYHMATGLGSQAYSFLFRGVPVGVMLSTFEFYSPERASTWGYTALSLVFAGYLGVLINYLVGITSFWTNETRTAYWVAMSLQLGFGGASMPLEVLPAGFQQFARLSPFPCTIYYPARIFLEKSSPSVIWYGVLWSVCLTGLALWTTEIARRKLEVQGG